MTTIVNFDQAAQDLVGRGFGVIPFSSGVHRGVGDTLDLFGKSIIDGLSAEEREQWQFHFPELSTKPDHGLCNRSKTNGRDRNEDDKFFLHWRAGDRPERLMRNLLKGRGVDITPYETFFQSCDLVFTEALSLGENFAQKLDEHYGWNLFEALQKPQAMEQHVLRLLSYDQKSIGQELANTHWDFSALTLCLWETEPGLFFDLKESRYNWSFKVGRVPVFGGRKIFPFTQTVQPLAHGVEAIHPGRRLAAVFFAHIDGPMGPALEEN